MRVSHPARRTGVVNGQTGNHAGEEPHVEIHPAKAAKHGIKRSDSVIIPAPGGRAKMGGIELSIAEMT